MSKVDDIIAKAEVKTAAQTSAEAEAKAKAEAEKANGGKDKEVLTKEQHLSNLNVAIAEANRKLKLAREGKTEVKVEEEIPKIDMEDPSSKAWDKHIQDSVNPIKAESDQEKQEIFDSAIKDFLSDKPAVTSDPKKLEEFIDTYETLSRGKISGRTKEGVTQYLSKAFAAVYSDPLINAARDNRVDRARLQELFSSPGVDSGATGYNVERTRTPDLTDEDRDYIRRMGYASVEDWKKDLEKK